MARSAHAQHPCKLRELPKCSRCKMEFILVAANYEKSRKTVIEWECPKCHKAIPRELLREDPPSEWEAFLHETCKANNERRREDTDNSSKHR